MDDGDARAPNRVSSPATKDPANRSIGTPVGRNYPWAMASHAITSDAVKNPERVMQKRTAGEHPGRSWSIAAVIPTHNRAALIGRAIDSALAQLRPPDEVIVVDDGSTDNTAEVVARYGDRVTLITKQQGGVSSARNVGVESSHSDYIAFLDSDDLWEPAHVLRMEQAIEATNGEAVLYFSDLRLGSNYSTATVWEPSGFAIDGPYELRVDGCDWLFGPLQPMLIPASVVRRDAYLGVGGSDTRFVCRGDTHLFFKIGMAGPVCAVAGFAGEVTHDDRASITATFDPGLDSYLQCTLWLYNDLLQDPRLTRAQRAVVRRRIAAAYWGFAKQRGLRKPVRAARSVLRATRYEPTLLPKRLWSRTRRVTRGIARSPRPESAE